MNKNIILIASILLLMLSCSTDSKDKLIVGIIKPSLNHLPFDFGLQTGTLDKEDYIIKNFSSGWETNEALISGKIDVAIMPFTYIWSDISNGKKVKIISFFERESDGIIARKDIKTISELEGKKIGVLRASTLDIFAEMLSDKYEIKFELVYLRTPIDMAAALQAGEVDALSFYVPSIFRFNEDFKIIHWYSKDYPFHTCCDISATESALSTKLPIIKKFLSDLEKSTDELNNSPNVAFDAAATFFKLSKKASKNSLYNTKYIMGLDEQFQQFEIEAINKMIEKGYIKNEVKAKDVYFKVE